MTSWDEFRAEVPGRLLLPLREYRFIINFVKFNPTEDDRNSISERITAAFVDTVQSSPDPTLSALRILPPGNSFVSIDYGDPVYNFQLTLDEDSIVIVKTTPSIESFVLTLPLLRQISEHLFTEDGKYSLTSHPFFGRSFRTSHVFEQSIMLGTRMSDESIQPTNLDIMRHFSNLDESSGIGAIQPNRVLRNDIEIAMEKLVGGRVAKIWIDVDAPWNFGQRVLEFEFQLRRDGGARVQETDLIEFEAVAVLFLRDLVISRLYRQIFHDIHVMPGI